MKKHTIEICIGTSCHLMGSQDLLTTVNNLPGEIKNFIELRTVPCLKACDKAPAIRINGQVYQEMTPDKLISQVKELLR